MSSSKGFTPPFFSKFAKSAKDLFKKKYEFDHQLKAFQKTNNGLSIETGAVIASDSGSLKGYGKGKYNSKDFGEFETEVWTHESNESKATVKLSKLATGVNLTLGATTKDKDKSLKGPVGSADFEYSQEGVAINTVVKSNLTTTKLDDTISFGYDGASVGGQAVVDVSKGFDLVDYNAGVEYTQKDLTASFYTENKLAVLNAALFQQPNADTIYGAIFKFDTEKQSRSLQLGADYKVDTVTQVRGKIELPEGTISAVVEQRLNNPNILLQVASQFATKPTLTSTKLGVSLSVGHI